MRYIIIILLLLLAVLSCGCTSVQSGSSLSLSMQADPNTVLQNSLTKVHIDITNLEEKQLEDVSVDIFSPGLMTYADEQTCITSGTLGFLRKGEFRSFSCDLRAPEIIQDRITTTIDAKAIFITTLSAVQPLELYTEMEYNNRLASKGPISKPQSYTHSDRNIALQVDFTDPLPLVVKSNRKQYVKFTITNIGSGFIDPISPDDIEIEQTFNSDINRNLLQSIALGGEYKECDLEETIVPIEKEFPAFSCQIMMPENIPSITNYNFVVKIRYKYEIRTSTTVDVIR